MHVTSDKATDFAAEVAAQRVILQCILSRLSLVAEAESGITPRAWLNALLERADCALDGDSITPPAFIERVRNRLADTVSGSIPVKARAKP